MNRISMESMESDINNMINNAILHLEAAIAVLRAEDKNSMMLEVTSISLALPKAMIDTATVLKERLEEIQDAELD